MKRELVDHIFKAYDEAGNKILLCVEASLPPQQFKAARKLILDALGLSGAKGKVSKLLEEQGRAGKS